MKITILRIDGTREEREIGSVDVFRHIEKAIGANALDGINLRDGRCMFVDDYGYETEFIDHGIKDGPMGPTRHFENRCVRARKPANVEATKLYHAVCNPGTTHQIVGDVAIVNDADFKEDES